MVLLVLAAYVIGCFVGTFDEMKGRFAEYCDKPPEEGAAADDEPAPEYPDLRKLAEQPQRVCEVEDLVSVMGVVKDVFDGGEAVLVRCEVPRKSEVPQFVLPPGASSSDIKRAAEWASRVQQQRDGPERTYGPMLMVGDDGRVVAASVRPEGMALGTVVVSGWPERLAPGDALHVVATHSGVKSGSLAVLTCRVRLSEAARKSWMWDESRTRLDRRR